MSTTSEGHQEDSDEEPENVYGRIEVECPCCGCNKSYLVTHGGGPEGGFLWTGSRWRRWSRNWGTPATYEDLPEGTSLFFNNDDYLTKVRIEKADFEKDGWFEMEGDDWETRAAAD